MSFLPVALLRSCFAAVQDSGSPFESGHLGFPALLFDSPAWPSSSERERARSGVRAQRRGAGRGDVVFLNFLFFILTTDAVSPPQQTELFIL